MHYLVYFKKDKGDVGIIPIAGKTELEPFSWVEPTDAGVNFVFNRSWRNSFRVPFSVWEQVADVAKKPGADHHAAHGVHMQYWCLNSPEHADTLANHLRLLSLFR